MHCLKLLHRTVVGFVSPNIYMFFIVLFTLTNFRFEGWQWIGMETNPLISVHLKSAIKNRVALHDAKMEKIHFSQYASCLKSDFQV